MVTCEEWLCHGAVLGGIHAPLPSAIKQAGCTQRWKQNGHMQQPDLVVACLVHQRWQYDLSLVLAQPASKHEIVRLETVLSCSGYGFGVKFYPLSAGARMDVLGCIAHL